MTPKELKGIRRLIKGILIFIGVGLLVSVVILCSQKFYQRTWTQKQKAERVREHYLAVLKDNPKGFGQFKQSTDYTGFEHAGTADSVEYFYRSFFDSSFRKVAAK